LCHFFSLSPHNDVLQTSWDFFLLEKLPRQTRVIDVGAVIKSRDMMNEMGQFIFMHGSNRANHTEPYLTAQ